MIQIKYKNQGVKYLQVVRDVLLIGVVQYCNRGQHFHNCDGCNDKSACSDIQRAIGYLDKLIKEEEKAR